MTSHFILFIKNKMCDRSGLQMTKLKNSQSSVVNHIWVESNDVKEELGEGGRVTTISSKLTNKLKELEHNLIEQGKKRREIQRQLNDMLEQLPNVDKQYQA